MLRKIITVIAAILVLALIGLVVREHVWPPGPALASSTTLTALSGEEVSLNGEKISKTVVVKEGDSVKTGANSWALITFENGSTVELEPNTEVLIQEMTDTSISLWQQIGRTWSRVERLVGPLAEFKTETPSAAAVVRGTLIDINVDALGNTTAAAFEGVVEVIAEGVSRTLEAGMQSIIEMYKAPEEPKPIPPPKNRLEFTIRGPAWALVVDSPQERSVGVVPPGVVATQIPGATTTGTKAEPQFIVVPVPEEEGTREYSIVLYGKDEGTVSVEVKGYAKGKNIFTETKEALVEPYEKYDGEEKEKKYVATLTVTLDADGLITGGELGDFELKPTKGPGTVEIKDWSVSEAGEVVAPQANFSVSVEEDTIRFTSLSTGDITSYLWDFGDGDTSEEPNPAHEYEESGGYVVSLTVSGPGGEDTISKAIYVILV